MEYKLINGDCVEETEKLESESIGYTIFSPPFASLYTYSDNPKDMGNCSGSEEFFRHFDYLIPELFRVTKSGRCLSFHCMNLPTSKEKHGVIGIEDFRGKLILAFQKHGFIYRSEVCIWKDPVVAMHRTKSIGLLYKQLKKDSCISRQGIADYLITMWKPGENKDRVFKKPENFPVTLWQQYASPVWMDINPSNTLQSFRDVRETKDERHICPLQLEIIERGIILWSNPTDTILSPFAGVGSEGYVSLKNGRNFIGFELKKSYYDQAIKNLEFAKNEQESGMLI